MPITATETIRVLVAAVVLLAPGWLLLAPLFGPGRPRGAAGPALGAGIGVGAYGLFLWIAARLHAPLSSALAVWIAIAAAGGLVLWLRARGRRKDAEPAATGPLDLSGRPGRVLAATCLAAALIAPVFGAYSGPTSDAWDYLNRATSILRADRLDAPNPYSPEFHNPYDPTFYGVIASVARLSGVPPARLWQAFPIVATPIEIGVVAATTAIIISSASAGAAAAVIYTVVYGPFFLFKNSGHHQMLGDLPYLVALAALFLYWRHGRRRHLVLGALAGAAAVTYHHFFLVQTAFTIGLAGLALLVYGRPFAGRARRAVTYVVTVALALLPLALFIHFAYLQKLDPKAMNRTFVEVYSPLLHFGPLYMPDPFRWYFTILWHPLPALLAVIYLAGRFGRDHRAGTLALLVAAPVLIVLDPIVFPAVVRVTSLQVASRLLNLTTYPSVMVLGWIVAEWLAGRRVGDDATTATAPSAGMQRRAALFVAGLSILAIVPQTLMLLQSDYVPWSVKNEKENSPGGWAGALSELAHRATPGQTVLSDPTTSYSMPSFAPVSIVADQRDDFAFQAPDPIEREAALEKVLDPLSPPDSTIGALVGYHVDWIVVNRRFANPMTIEKLGFLGEAGPGIRKEFEKEGLVVYSVNRPATGEVAAVPDSALYDRVLIPPATFASLKEPGTGLLFDPSSGIGAVIGPDSAAVGDTVYVTLYYEWRQPAPRANYYPKLLREGAYGSRARWFVRQVRKSMLGRLDSVLFPRDLEFKDVRTRRLMPGYVFADIFSIEIPAGTTSGNYGLYLREGGFPTEGNTGLPLGGLKIVPKTTARR